jgi:hypothetical protein
MKTNKLVKVRAKRRPTLARVEKVLGPARSWSGRCHEVAIACVQLGLVEGVAVYGHWVGFVHARSYFAHRSHLPFVRHGWVKLADGTIFDPTRWAFEAAEPYLYFGPNDGEYDEGGNVMRAMGRGSAPRFDPADKCFRLDDVVLSSEGWYHAEQLLEEDYEDGHEPGTVSRGQLAWLANAPYEDLLPYAWEIYRALDVLGKRAYVPIDNYRRARREQSGGVSCPS